MMRKFIALAATALFCVAMSPNVASARMGGGGGHFGGGHFGGGHFGGGSFAGAHFSGGHVGAWGGGFRGPAFGGFRHHAFFPRDRFFFRHRFRRFPGFFVASSFDDYGCFIPRRVWTPWGWRWRRIWVCG